MPHLARAGSKQRVLILGGGFGGAYAAQTLSAKLPKDWELTIVDRNNFLLFYPLLVEAGVGSLEARHVVVPTRKFLKRGELLMAEIQGVDLKNQAVKVQVIGAENSQRIHYDQLIIAIGSTTRFPNIPGLKEHAFQLKSLADGIDLRDHGIRLLELANTIADPTLRREILRVVVVGANFTGMEFAGEYQDFLTDAAKAYDNIDPSEVSVVVVEMGERILNALQPELSDFAYKHLTGRGLDIRTKTTVTEIGEHHVVLSTGERLATRTAVWCAGIAPSPVLEEFVDLPRNKFGYIDCEQNFRVKGYENVWAVGDIATILDKDGKPYPATAQNATRQGKVCAKNILRSITGEAMEDFRFSPLGSLAALGCRSAVAQLFGIRLAGFPAWFMYRTVYLFKMPSWSRRIRIMMDWTTDLFFRRDPVQLGVRRVVRAELAKSGAEETKASLR